MTRILATLLLFLLAVPAYAAGPIWHSDLNQNTGTTVNPNVGTQTCAFTNSPTWTTGKFSYGIDLDAGTTDYLDCGTTHLISTDDWTVAVWVKAESSAASRIIITQGDLTGAGKSGMQMWIHSGDTLRCSAYTGTNVLNTAASTAAINETGSVWTHVACKKSGTAITSWINGAQDGSATAATATMDYTGTAPKYFIGTNSDLSVPLSGQIDDVRLYNTAEDVAAIFAINPSRRGGPIIFP